MGKKYLVEVTELEEEVIGKFIVGIVVIGIMLLISWYFFKSIFVGIINLADIKTFDIEIFGILVGIIIAWIIFLVMFIKNQCYGLFEAIYGIVSVLFPITIISTIICSVIVPIVAIFIIFETFQFDMWDFLKTLFFNSIILTLCSPLIVLISIVVVSILGTIFGYIFYKIIYKIKAINIKKLNVGKR